MPVELKILRKWIFVTLYCGAHSFIWGLMAGGKVSAMLLGLATLIAGLTFIECLPRFRMEHESNPFFSYALHQALKLCLNITSFTFITTAAVAAIRTSDTTSSFEGYAILFMIPQFAEIGIGVFASRLCEHIIGFSPVSDICCNAQTEMPYGLDSFDQFAATYMTTVIMGLLHCAIIASLTGYIYVCSRAREKYLRR